MQDIGPSSSKHCETNKLPFLTRLTSCPKFTGLPRQYIFSPKAQNYSSASIIYQNHANWLVAILNLHYVRILYKKELLAHLSLWNFYMKQSFWHQIEREITLSEYISIPINNGLFLKGRICSQSLNYNPENNFEDMGTLHNSSIIYRYSGQIYFHFRAVWPHFYIEGPGLHRDMSPTYCCNLGLIPSIGM